MKNFDAALHFTILYGAIVAFSFISGAFDAMKPKKKKQYLFIVLLALGIIMGFRSMDVGNDTISYIRRFYTLASYNNPFDAVESSSAEVGYVLYSWILGQLFSNARILFVVNAIITCVSFGYFVNKYCTNPGVFCCLFVGILLFDFVLSAMRQAVAIAILLFAFDAMLEKRVARYYLLTTVAVLFHNAAVIFFLVYPGYWIIENQGKFKSISIAVLILIVCIFAYNYNFFIRIVLRLFPKYEYYLGGAYLDGETRLAIILKIAVYSLLFFVPKIFRRSDKAPTQLDSATAFFSVANILFLFASTRATLLTRIATNFLPVCILQFANSIQEFSRNNRKILIVLTCVAFYAYGLTIVMFRTPEWQTTYPIDLSWLI